jgi:hypothetical protein
LATPAQLRGVRSPERSGTATALTPNAASPTANPDPRLVVSFNTRNNAPIVFSTLERYSIPTRSASVGRSDNAV